MAPADEDLVRSSWEKVTGAISYETMGLLIYSKMFEKDPTIRTELFAGVNMSKQAPKLIEMIDTAVKLLDKPSALVPELLSLGERHGSYGTQAHHFGVAGEAVILVLQQGLGPAFTPDVKQAWINVYDVIQGVMVQGLTNDRGQALFAQWEQRQKKKAQGGDSANATAKEEVMDVESDEDRVRRTWVTMKEKYTHEQLGTIFYGTLFQLDPSLPSTLFRDARPLQAIKLIETIDAAVQSLAHPISLVPKLITLGERHGGYGVTAQHLALGGEALSLMLTRVLGSAATPKVKKAWASVYSVVSVTMTQGLHGPKGRAASKRYLESHPNPVLSAEEWVARTWTQVTTQFTFQQVGSLFYDALFEKAPQLRTTVFKNTDLNVQSERLIEMIDHAVAMLKSPAKLTEELVQLGVAHAKYGVREEHFPIVRDTLLTLLGGALGAEKFPSEAKQAWSTVFDIIQGAMVTGIKQATA